MSCVKSYCWEVRIDIGEARCHHLFKLYNETFVCHLIWQVSDQIGLEQSVFCVDLDRGISMLASGSAIRS